MSTRDPQGAVVANPIMVGDDEGALAATEVEPSTLTMAEEARIPFPAGVNSELLGHVFDFCRLGDTPHSVSGAAEGPGVLRISHSASDDWATRQTNRLLAERAVALLAERKDDGEIKTYLLGTQVGLLESFRSLGPSSEGQDVSRRRRRDDSPVRQLTQGACDPDDAEGGAGTLTCAPAGDGGVQPARRA